jgi:hypothetical protein
LFPRSYGPDYRCSIYPKRGGPVTPTYHTWVRAEDYAFPEGLTGLK